MKKTFTILLLLAFSLAQASDGLFDYLMNAKRQSTKSLLIIFYREDCPHCVNMSRELRKEAALTTLLLQTYAIRKINIRSEEGSALAKRFNVTGVPAIIRYDPDAGATLNIKGYPGATRLGNLLQLNGPGIPANKTEATTQADATCGDGIIEAGELCDDGNTVSGDGCDSNCTPTACGNGVVAGTESCDDGNAVSGDGCDNNCTPTGCGNSIITAGESCDDGNTTDGDGCDSNCSITGCGNGIISAGETCDDGNNISGDGCDNNCTPTACGNGVVAGTEVCDDGNTVSGDGCDYNCTITGCGNGVITAGESCDDGNITNGDGCSSTCSVESDPPVCGNLIIEAGEECDDGNITAGDGCSSTCTIENVPGTIGVSINDDGSQPNPTAMLDIKSKTKGILIPRMTTAQREAIASPEKGLMVFDITTSSFWFFKADEFGWVEIDGPDPGGFSILNTGIQTFAGHFTPAFTSKQYDEGGHVASGVFKSPVAGFYELKANATFTLSSVSTQTILTLRIENIASGEEYGSNSIIIPAGFTGMIKLQASAHARMYASTPAGIKILVNGSPGTQTLSAITFSGAKAY